MVSVGTHLGPYEILSLLGAGGMGEVYRARDTRLGRDVAIKVLPPVFADDPERMARFEREAQVLASLNHPNIAQLYGLEERALVMEYVPGDTLRCPLPVDEILPVVRQIIDALEEAHERGIVHRDLKPANIKVTPDGKVKVLDFGLAKAFADDPSATNASNSPTLAATALTRSAVLLGTAAYMSPEQARGKPVDKRSDIFAFGAVLYEMLTGRQAFGGETISDSLAAILTKDPDRARLPAGTPSHLRRLLDRCLEKDPKRRLRDIGEARLILEGEPANYHQDTNTQRHKERPWFSLVSWCLRGGIAVLVLALAAVSVLHFRETPPPQPVPIRFTVAPPENGTVDSFSLSPDGRYLAMAAAVETRQSLWLRASDTVELRPLAGTEDARFPFWSPDSRFLGFFAGGKLKKVAVQGGPTQTLCDAADALGGTWNQDGVIVFAPQQASPLFRVAAAGGVPVPATNLEAAGGGFGHAHPTFLPSGRHFLFLAFTAAPEKRGIYLGSLDSLEVRRLLSDQSNAFYAAGPSNNTGHLLFVRESTLVAQPFDPVRLELAGDLFPVAEQVRGVFGRRAFSVSAAGAMAFESGTGGSAGRTELVWFDREGKRLGVVGEPGDYRQLALSPDEKQVAVSRQDRGNQDIWVLEITRQAASRLTSDPALDVFPTWSPEGDRLAFQRVGVGTFLKTSAGAGQEELLLKFQTSGAPLDWSPDGRSILHGMTNAKTRGDLAILPVTGDRKLVPLVQTEFNEREARFSPEGRFVAYISDETGRYEVYIQPVPPAGAKWPVSSGGARQPEWRRDGKELFYIAPDRKLMAVAVTTGPKFEAGAPRALFETRVAPYTQITGRNYAVTADGRRFLINTEMETAVSKPAPITVVVNWQAGVNK